MYKCPHCKKKGIPFSKRLRLSPFNTVNCDKCDKEVSIPVWSFLLLLPIPITTYIGRYLEAPIIYKDLIIILGAVISFALYLALTPITRK